MQGVVPVREMWGAGIPAQRAQGCREECGGLEVECSGWRDIAEALNIMADEDNLALRKGW